MPPSQPNQKSAAVAAPSRLGPVQEEAGRHQRFDPHELAIVLSHYDLGVISDITAFKRGSRRAPKVRIRTRRGEYLLKRRAAGRDDPYRVAFTHGLQLHLAQRGFPVARLIGTQADNNSMMQHNGRIYELFEYVRGKRYARSAAEAVQSGVTLGALHRLLSDHQPRYHAPASTFHGLSEIGSRLEMVPSALETSTPDADPLKAQATCAFLAEAYQRAAAKVDDAGFRSWPPCLLHGDWHPGNLLYRERVVVSVLDFDSARQETRMADVANAALQFSMKMSKAESPEEWPEGLDLNLIGYLLRGYNQAAGRPIQPEERKALPWLMIEALILESVVPIAATGMFGGINGLTFLQMVESKVRWIVPKADEISNASA